MADEEAQRIIDAERRGEIPLGSIEAETRRSDEGGISSTVRSRCGPCERERHNECEVVMCDCNDPFHQRDTQ
jgi:hypothetical protein